VLRIFLVKVKLHQTIFQYSSVSVQDTQHLSESSKMIISISSLLYFKNVSFFGFGSYCSYRIKVALDTIKPSFEAILFK